MTTRRTFLRGAGAAIALPFLPSLAPRTAHAAGTVPTRLLFFYVPNGVHQANWWPEGTGADFTFGSTMASLEAYRDDVLVISGLRNDGGKDDRPGDHARGTGAFLTCKRPTFDGVDLGISVDQVAANAIVDETPFRSLELGVQGGGSFGVCDSGYSCAYTQNIAWAGPTTPMPKITNPQVAFDRLFGGGDQGLDAEARARRAIYRTSVLDEVKEGVDRLRTRVATDDAHRLDEYLTGVREVERRISSLGACGTEQTLPDEITLQEHPDILLDLAVAAFECDLTRYVTFMLGNAGSNHVYNFLDGVRGAHHELSHHQNLEANLDQLAVIDRWEVERFSRLLGRLSQSTAGADRLLDHTIVVMSSEISDGNRHNHDHLPVIVAGGAKTGAVLGGRHLSVDDTTPIANLYTSLLGAVGIDETFSDASGPLEGLAG